jgi:hypothetical protein
VAGFGWFDLSARILSSVEISYFIPTSYFYIDGIISSTANNVLAFLTVSSKISTGRGFGWCKLNAWIP